MCRYISKDELEKARSVDLLTYMQQREPDNLVRLSDRIYRLVEHDSVMLSNGLWQQKSTGIGGKSALDYLVRVRGMPLPEAASLVLGLLENSPYQHSSQCHPALAEKSIKKRLQPVAVAAVL